MGVHSARRALEERRSGNEVQNEGKKGKLRDKLKCACGRGEGTKDLGKKETKTFRKLAHRSVGIIDRERGENFD